MNQNFNALRVWVKRKDHPVAHLLYNSWKGFRSIGIPVIPGVHFSLYKFHLAINGLINAIMRVFYWTPLFKSRTTNSAKRLYLYGGSMPLILGPLRIALGDDCRVSCQTTFSGRTSSIEIPLLTVGNNVEIGWQTTIAVGNRVTIGNNVLIAGQAFLAGYPGHPLDPKDRASGLPDTDNQVGEIILEDNVWLATGVTVLSGVKIGEGTVIAAGSVVTKSIPKGVLAGGVPAKIIRQLSETTQ